MSNLKNKIKNKLHEAGNDKSAMQASFNARLKDAEDVVKTTLGASTPPEDVKNIAARLATESTEMIDEVNQEVLDKFIQQYGSEKGKQIYYATANKQDRNPETFHTEGEHDSVGRGIEYGMNPEVEVDKYEEYRQLMQQLAAEEGDENPNNPVQSKPTGLEEADPTAQPTNDPIKLKADVEKLMAKLDISGIAPYLEKIDNPTEQAEVIAQFAEKIGVPKARLSSVIAQLKTVAESKRPTMTKDALIEAVTGKKPRKVIKTVKVKDIK